MKTIYKYVLDETIRMPDGAAIYSVGVQEGKAVVWALVDTDMPTVERKMMIVGTGWDFTHDPRLQTARFIGTIQQPPFVWHVFEDLS